MTFARRAHRGLVRSILVAVLSAGVVAPAAARPAIGAIAGEWRNQKDIVRIRAFACGDRVCATVIRASAKAQADARKGGTDQLVGTQVFRNFRPSGDSAWKGKVFVPDLNRTFSGRLTVTGDDRLIGQGCVLGGLICKSTTWVRVSEG